LITKDTEHKPSLEPLVMPKKANELPIFSGASLFRKPYPDEMTVELAIPEIINIIRRYYKLIGYDKKSLTNLGRLLSNRGFEV